MVVVGAAVVAGATVGGGALADVLVALLAPHAVNNEPPPTNVATTAPIPTQRQRPNISGPPSAEAPPTTTRRRSLQHKTRPSPQSAQMPGPERGRKDVVNTDQPARNGSSVLGVRCSVFGGWRSRLGRGELFDAWTHLGGETLDRLVIVRCWHHGDDLGDADLGVLGKTLSDLVGGPVRLIRGCIVGITGYLSEFFESCPYGSGRVAHDDASVDRH